jgi:NADPH:quinone reductase-like Zn-dependent oxidoreductase
MRSRLHLVERHLPPPAAGEALIAVHASAINARDFAIVSARFPVGGRPPRLVPLSDGVGTVVAVGAGVTEVKPGDRVTANHFSTWIDGRWDPAVYDTDTGNSRDGWLADQVLLPARCLARLPDDVDDITACTLPVAGVTAWHALYEIARVRAGDTVLSLGTGGVSTWGVALARASGARVVVTSSSDAKLERMRALGAAATVNYRSVPDWGAEVLRQTGGADIVLENVGRETLDQSMQACAPGARIVMIGTAPLPPQLPKMPGFYTKNLSMKAISNGSHRMLLDLVAAVSVNRLRAVVERSFAFEDALDAFDFAAGSDHIGKVVIRNGTA